MTITINGNVITIVTDAKKIYKALVKYKIGDPLQVIYEESDLGAVQWLWQDPNIKGQFHGVFATAPTGSKIFVKGNAYGDDYTIPMNINAQLMNANMLDVKCFRCSTEQAESEGFFYIEVEVYP